MQIHFQNTCGLDSRELAKVALSLTDYLAHLQSITKHYEYDGKETAMNLPFDKGIADETCEIAKKFSSNNLKFIFVVGIGGSNLGTSAVYEALTGKYDLTTNTYPKMIFLDTVTLLPHMHVESIVEEDAEDASDIVVNVISKSGKTTETIANFDVLYKMLTKKFPHVHERVIVTTLKDSPLWKAAEKNGFMCLDHRDVTGRFSVMSAVGQLPLRLAGFDVDSLLKGATDATQPGLSTDIHSNPALACAVSMYLNAMHGKNLHNVFFFNPELELLGKWYRQLIAESLGKNTEAGITPLVSIGSTDLHSMVQLYFAGPRQTFTNFVYAKEDDNLVVENASGIVEVIPQLEGRKLGSIMEAIYEAVTTTYAKKGLPFMETFLPDISEYTLGQYMQTKIIEIVLLAHLFHVHAFDQPQVEDYKSILRNILT
ncbi:hypothetical protein A3B02_02510 [Candidatus Roizmanbacteria bacterium RIFCSPLOWO2_01_FULL_42_14]|uniref:Glucose-6-phosphate isomerase n=3 Tax=Candidatus Roizmaniibacteriota TaxID=1752723 RepID=A0A1F7JWD1_9BACT|nr:MAG: hypothetical protein A3D08_00130 [Candidatus Roizmanbacteria bacterium RIFCSPHIGHO2_02_FULL_43_11]OGK51776.1 MAG: hypothetical protein A3B02_02510 [Candidatus Roizmanbacteria bacterium RIFCSPLOWO2_01_FULL_42_14]OGK59874.1 MAG: hypothetical protein A3I56_03330 [Candidatus Roizmanbacteria bacterium RIFCSPLOWO2_02_FULL_43_10]